jgi:transposase
VGGNVRLLVGDDWAEDHHDVEVLDAAGRRLARARLPEGVAGIARLHAILGELAGQDVEDEHVEVLVGIETDRGPWVAALVAAGYQVFAVNPLQAARYRQRHTVSGAKSDTGDAHVLADMVGTDAHQLRPVASDSAQAEAVKVVARTHKTLLWSAPATPSGCGTRCGSTSPPRSRRSRTWTRRTRWSCWPRRRIRRRRPG